MNDELLEMLSCACWGSTAFLAIGNTDRADDGAGVALGRLLRDAGVPLVFEGGMQPENAIPLLRDQGCESIVFLDAVDVAAEPGAVVVMDTADLVGRFPQVSTHKLSLGTLARLAADGRDCRVWLVGIQPESIALDGARLSDSVDETVRTLAESITSLMTAQPTALKERACN